MSGESAIAFDCQGETLFGVLHRPVTPGHRGVVIVVGGPQTRVGSHRQFVLLARALAAAGVAALRFDYRGMGDSSGSVRDFTTINADIRAAVDCLFQLVPGINDVALWGLCDAASAAMFYAPHDPRVGGIALANPWARTDAGQARAIIHDYYLRRIMDPNLWRKILRGEFEWRASIASFGAVLRKGLGRARKKTVENVAEGDMPFPLREKMHEGLRRYRGRVLLLLSGDDLTAREFKDMLAESWSWRRLIRASRVVHHDLAEMNHTFSRAAWRDEIARRTLDWLRSW
jgi:exosortase A-associated hydrolase 1